MSNYSCLYNLLNLFIDTSLDDLIMEQTANTTENYNDQMILHICGCSLRRSPLKKYINIYFQKHQNTPILRFLPPESNYTPILRLSLTQTAPLPSIFVT